MNAFVIRLFIVIILAILAAVAIFFWIIGFDDAAAWSGIIALFLGTTLTTWAIVMQLLDRKDRSSNSEHGISEGDQRSTNTISGSARIFGNVTQIGKIEHPPKGESPGRD